MDAVLAITLCLATAPDDCRVARVPIYDAPLIACAAPMIPQNVNAARLVALPGERVAKIECEGEA